MNKIYYILSFIAAILSGCATLGEPPAKKDSKPPAAYKPVFISKIQAYDPNANAEPETEIACIDTRQANSVKIRLHISDSNSIYLKNLSQKKYASYWCEIIDSINGREIKIKNPKIYEVNDGGPGKLAVAIVMDHSGSMGDERAYAVQKAVAGLIGKKKDDENFTLIKFDDKVITESPLSPSGAELMKNFRIKGLEGFGGYTAIADGAEEGIKRLAGLPRRYEKAVVVLTDGWDNSSKTKRDSVIKLARRNDIMVCGIDFGDNVNPEYMKSFSDSSSGMYRQMYLTEEFPLLFEDVYSRLKNYYVIEYKPNEYGEHKIKIRLCFPGGEQVISASYNNFPQIGEIGTLAINFKYDKHDIDKDSREEIDEMFAFMEAFPGMAIELRGHTDTANNTGDPEYNMKLSQKRADAVKQALVKKGVDAARITTRGMGDTEPLYSNEEPEGRAGNRRTEFIIVKI